LINKLQNSIILSVLQILKVQNVRLVGNSILNSSCEFCYDDITVTSFINIKYCDVATEILSQRTACRYCIWQQVLYEPSCKGLWNVLYDQIMSQ